MAVNHTTLSVGRVRKLLATARQARVLVVGDVMLDQFIWGGVSRISPEAPVPVVDFERESFMPGGAANVARNLAALERPHGTVRRDRPGRCRGRRLKNCSADKNRLRRPGANAARHTSVKTRIVAHQQQVVRIDRETRDGLDAKLTGRLLAEIKSKLRA
jgi:D-glycero-beta-D-manno-heptose-7-phosphate kinase